VDVQVDLADNVQDLQRVQVDLADNAQVSHRDQAAKADRDNVLVVQVQEQVLHIVQVVTPVAVLQADLIDQVAHVRDLAVAEILQVHSVRVDLRRVTRRRAEKRYAMILKICRRLHLVA
jgi:hypothetical protein